MRTYIYTCINAYTDTYMGMPNRLGSKYALRKTSISHSKALCVWVGRWRSTGQAKIPFETAVRESIDVKLIAFELAGSRPKGKPRSEPFENCVFRVAQTWLNGIFPSPREFCGQLKRNQLYERHPPHIVRICTHMRTWTLVLLNRDGSFFLYQGVASYTYIHT